MTDAPDDLESRPVLVLDFGAQYAQLIARRVREANVYSEVVPHTTPVERLLERHPAAIVLSGGPSSVYEEGDRRSRPRGHETCSSRATLRSMTNEKKGTTPASITPTIRPSDQRTRMPRSAVATTYSR